MMRIEIDFPYSPTWTSAARNHGFGDRPIAGKTSIDIAEVGSVAAPPRWQLTMFPYRHEVIMHERNGTLYEPVRIDGVNTKKTVDAIKEAVSGGCRPQDDLVYGGFRLVYDSTIDIARAEANRLSTAEKRLGRPSGMHPLIIESGDHRSKEAIVRAAFQKLSLIAVDGIVMQRVDPPVLVIDPMHGPALHVCYGGSQLVRSTPADLVFPLNQYDAAVEKFVEMGGKKPLRAPVRSLETEMENVPAIGR